MDRWTIKQLKETNDLNFIISILNERRNKVTPYSPLGAKLSEITSKVAKLRYANNEETIEILKDMRGEKNEN